MFVISWVNPDERHAGEGLRALHDRGHPRGARRDREGDRRKERSTLSAIASAARCSAITLGYLAAIGEERIASATLLTAQIDFEFAGDLKVFADADRIASVEAEMKKTGYLEGSKMATAFNLLRSNDLIWPYVVNDYLKGKEPAPLRPPLLERRRNAHAGGEPLLLPAQLLSGEQHHQGPRRRSPASRIDLSRVTVPVYNLATKEDHIAPGEIGVRRLAFSRRAGALRADRLRPYRRAWSTRRPRKKYQYWTGGPPNGTLEDWLRAREEHPGSWWDDWQAWLEALRWQAHQEEAPARRRQAEADRGRARLIRDGAKLRHLTKFRFRSAAIVCL